MEEPNIEQFGLSRVEYIYLNKHKDRGHKAIKAISISIAFLAVASIYWHVYSADDIGLRIFQSLIAGLFMGSISGYLIEKVIWLLYVDIRNRYSGQYQKLNQYEAAKTKYNSWWRRNQESFWTSLSGKQFESELASLYSKLGYEVESPKRGGADKGIDFLLMEGGMRIIVQCKAHKKPVGPHVARDLYGTLISSHARRAVLASTSGFTPGVIEFIRGKPIELLSVDTHG